jgi:hypothetical protein
MIVIVVARPHHVHRLSTLHPLLSLSPGHLLPRFHHQRRTRFGLEVFPTTTPRTATESLQPLHDVRTTTSVRSYLITTLYYSGTSGALIIIVARQPPSSLAPRVYIFVLPLAPVSVPHETFASRTSYLGQENRPHPNRTSSSNKQLLIIIMLVSPYGLY